MIPSKQLTSPHGPEPAAASRDGAAPSPPPLAHASWDSDASSGSRGEGQGGHASEYECVKIVLLCDCFSLTSTTLLIHAASESYEVKPESLF